MRDRDPGLLLLSAGDFYSEKGILDMYRSRFLASMMVLARYDAVAVGEKELSYDMKAIREDAKIGLPVICANLYYEGERLFPPYVVKETGGAKVGIFALLGEDFQKLFTGEHVSQMFTKAMKLLGLGHVEFNWEAGGEKRFVGNKTAARILKVVGERWRNWADDQP